MNLSKLHLIVLLFFVFYSVSNVIGLAICIIYGYKPETVHYMENSCLIDNCITTPHLCCYRDRWGLIHCSSCPTIAITYTLNLNETSYTKSYSDGRYDWFSYDVCNYPVIICHYDDRNVNDTLSLDYLPPPAGPTAGIVILSVSLTLFLILIAIWVFCYGYKWRHEDEPFEMDIFNKE